MSTGKARTSSTAIRRSRCKVLPTVEGDLEAVLEEGLRSQDIAEITAQTPDVAAAARRTLDSSGLLAFTIHVDGEPAALFGACRTDDPDIGIVWMFGTDRLRLISRDLIVEGRRWIDYLNEIFPVLANWVDSRNTTSVRWLKALGFQFPHTADYTTPSGVVFEEFCRCA